MRTSVTDGQADRQCGFDRDSRWALTKRFLEPLTLAPEHGLKTHCTTFRKMGDGPQYSPPTRVPPWESSHHR